MSIEAWIVTAIFHLAVWVPFGALAWLIVRQRRKSAKDWLRDFPHR